MLPFNCISVRLLLLGTLLITTVSADFNLREPQKTIAEWMKLKEKLTVDTVHPHGIYGKSCTATFTQSRAVRILYYMFSSYYGVGDNIPRGLLQEIWPYATYYATQLAPLQNLSSSDVCLLEGYSDIPYICHKGNCTYCAFENYDRTPSADKDKVARLCDLIDPVNLPKKGKPTPKHTKTLQTLLAVQSHRPRRNSINYTSFSSSSNLTWKDLKEIQRILKAKPRGKFETCGNDSIPMSIASWTLWRLFNLKDGDGVKLSEKMVKDNLQNHPEYYREHVGILKKAKPEDVTCKWGTFCGPDGICTVCGYQGIPEEFKGVCEFEGESERDIIIQRWEEESNILEQRLNCAIV